MKNRAANFDKLAGVYRWMEYLSFGSLLMLCRKEFLKQMKSARRGLILGDGDGRFTQSLLRTNDLVRVDAVDASARMLSALQRSAGVNAGRVQTQCEDLRSWQPADKKYDLVVTHFVLDCLTTEEVANLVTRTLPAVEYDALWVISEFAIPQGWWRRSVAVVLVGFLYRAFGLLTGLTIRRLPNHGAVLRSSGFEQIGLKQRLFGVLRSELWRRKGAA
jgi:hypothetical protein